MKKIKAKEIKFTLIVPTIKPTKRRLIKIANGKNNNMDWRYRYPECPGCKAIGEQGLKITRLGHLWCRNCRTQFTLERDKHYNIKVGKSMGD